MEATQDTVRSEDRMANRVGQSAREMGERAEGHLQGAMHQEPLQGTWEAMERIPVGAYYFAMMGSILAALGLYASGKKDTAQFVGQWAPTFALLGLMNKLLRPTRG